MSIPSPHIWIPPPKRVILPEEEQKPLFPGRRAPMQKASTYVNFVSGVITPDQVEAANLHGQFMADAADMYTDFGGTTPVSSDGDNVRFWTNQKAAAAGENARQSSTDRDPVYRASVINGYPGIEFGTTTIDHLAADALATYYDDTGGPWTLAIAFKQDSTTDFQTLWCISGGVGTENLSVNPATFLSNYQVFKSDGSSSDSALGGGAPDTNAHWLVITDAGTSVNAWLDGNQVMTNDTCAKDNTGLGFWTIGCLVRNTISSSLLGKICELWWWNINVSNADVEDVLVPYGMVKFGL